MGCKTRKYSDGGKVVDREYGTPTFGKALAAKVGVGDGYSYFPKKAPKPKDTRRRIDVSNATSEFGNVIAKRKKALDEI